MDAITTLSLLLCSLALSMAGRVQPPVATRPSSHITVMGTVYCDICSNNSFSRHSYFLPGVDVKIECKFKAVTEGTAEEITLSVNRTTNRRGWYKLDIPSVDGVECAKDDAMESLCRATLLGGTKSSSNSNSRCNVPGYKSTSDVIYIKSMQTHVNVCIYGLSAMTFRPSRRNKALCGN